MCVTKQPGRAWALHALWADTLFIPAICRAAVSEGALEALCTCLRA